MNISNSTKVLTSKSELKTSSCNSLSSSSKLTTTTKFCNPLCSECSQNDFNFCTICQPQSVLYKWTCYSQCPEGTYTDETRHCRECDPSCPICWGPSKDMCGSEVGIMTKVVSIEKEIKNFLLTYTFNRKEIEDWLESLKLVLHSGDSLTSEVREFSTKEVYEIKPNLQVDLPIGAFSKLNGVFIPVPSYINAEKELVNSHWIYKKGTWNGQTWVDEYYPRLPTFIRDKGEINKIYYENKGFWIWSKQAHWHWVKAKHEKEDEGTVQDELAMLNSIKIDVRRIYSRLARRLPQEESPGISGNKEA